MKKIQSIHRDYKQIPSDNPEFECFLPLESGTVYFEDGTSIHLEGAAYIDMFSVLAEQHRIARA